MRVSARASRGILKGLGNSNAVSAGSSTTSAAADVQQQEQQGEDAWLDIGSSWTSGLWGLGSLMTTATAERHSGMQEGQAAEGSSCLSMPSIEGPCLCVWQLTSVGPSGAPRLVSVITCDDMLQSRARLAAAAAVASPALAGKAAKHQAAAAANPPPWPVIATHTPTCFCMAVLQEGSLCCAACLAAAAGCTGSCCSSSLSATCCGGNCAALRCVVYGDTQGTLHAVELGYEEEAFRWTAHPGSPISAVSVSRACGNMNAAPDVWLVSAAAAAAVNSSSTSGNGSCGGMVLRCWSAVGIGETGPVLLHQLFVRADSVLPPGLSIQLPGSTSTRPAGAGGASATAAAAAGQSALSRLLGAPYKKTGDAALETADNRRATVFSLGGRSSLVVEGEGLILLARV